MKREEAEIKNIIDMSCEHFVAMPNKCKVRLAKTIITYLASHPEEGKSAKKVLSEITGLSINYMFKMFPDKEVWTITPKTIIKAMEQYRKEQSKGYPEECEWEYDENYDYYETSCGKGYSLIDGTLEENELKYCPYCGKLIKDK